MNDSRKFWDSRKFYFYRRFTSIPFPKTFQMPISICAKYASFFGCRVSKNCHWKYQKNINAHIDYTSSVSNRLRQHASKIQLQYINICQVNANFTLVANIQYNSHLIRHFYGYSGLTVTRNFVIAEVTKADLFDSNNGPSSFFDRLVSYKLYG